MIATKIFNNNALSTVTDDGKDGPEVIARGPIPLFQQGLMMQQLNSEKLIVEACIENSYEKALQAFTLNKTVPSEVQYLYSNKD